MSIIYNEHASTGSFPVRSWQWIYITPNAHLLHVGFIFSVAVVAPRGRNPPSPYTLQPTPPQTARLPPPPPSFDR